MVQRGKSTGHVGRVKAVDHKSNRLWVSGANMRKRHLPATETGKGGMYSAEGPVHYSAVALIDPVTKYG